MLKRQIYIKLHEFLVSNNIELQANNVVITFNANGRYKNKQRIHVFDFGIGEIAGQDPCFSEKEPMPKIRNMWTFKKNRLKKY